MGSRGSVGARHCFRHIVTWRNVADPTRGVHGALPDYNLGPVCVSMARSKSTVRSNQMVEVEVLALAISGISLGRGATHRNAAVAPTSEMSAHNSNGVV
jgi:hypothetical protein